jgi:RimJ/RimL family protein N-acetyltransferase
MKLKVLSAADCEQVRLWRNDCLQALRTPYPLTKEQQEEFYHNVVCNRNANSLYRGVTTEINVDGETEDMLIGMVGLENIERQNSRAEISIMIKPEYRAAGFGEQALAELLTWGFNTENLQNIYGECYLSNMAVDFWHRMVEKYHGYETAFPNTKYYRGVYWDSRLFNFNKEDCLCHK